MKYSIKCQVINKKNKEKNSPIRMRVSFAGVRVDLRLGLSVPSGCWDSDKEEAHTRKAEYKQVCAEINARIHEVTARIDQLFARCEFVDKRPPTINELKSIVNNRISSNRISDAFAEYLRENQHLELQSVLSYRTALNRVLHTVGDLYINEFSCDLINDMMNELSNKYKNTTLKSTITRIKSVLKLAQKKGTYTSDGLDYEFKYKMIQKVVVYLSIEELKAFEAYKSKNQSKQEIHDLFVFCCYTGLRISDARSLTWDNIKEGKLEIVTQKTSDPLIIELNSHAERILANRLNEASDSKKIFPYHCMSYYNKVIRDICRTLKFNEPVSYTYYSGNVRMTETDEKWKFVTSHTARKTFVVTAVTLGLPLSVIMKWTGHKTIKTLDPYLKIVDEVKARSMSKFDSL